jgi:peptide/nickel transport system ATP-binding protein
VILDVENLSVSYRSPSGVLDAVSNVSFKLSEGEVLGVVGESGSGKTTLALAIARLLDDRVGFYKSGKIRLLGLDMITAKESDVRRMRGSSLFMIFQDPFASLNPLMRIKDQLIEAISIRCKSTGEAFDPKNAFEVAIDALRAVRIGDPADVANRFPHQLSGGQNQRVMLAMAVVEKPKLLIADEPTTALDVTTQSQVLDLLSEIVRANRMSVLFVTHDLAIAGSISDRIMVMYGGMVQEIGPARSVLSDPKHPYTVGLINSIPSGNKKQRRLEHIPGSFSWTAELKTKCAFSPRCGYSREACELGIPSLIQIATTNGSESSDKNKRFVRCINYGELYDERRV